MIDQATARLRLSKSRYLDGLQCHKQLWWRVHDAEAPELVPDAALRNLFAQGRDVGVRAREFVPGGELIDLPFSELDNKVAATREALRRGPPALYRGGVPAAGPHAGGGIRGRPARGDGGIEGKSI